MATCGVRQFLSPLEAGGKMSTNQIQLIETKERCLARKLCFSAMG